MKLKLANVSLVLACLMGLSIPANAGGFGADAGSLKDGIYDGVPVPAPRPLPNYNAQWYVRADFGYSIATNDGLSSTGFGYTPYGTQDGPAALTLGMGRYLSSNLRAELAIDIRSEYNLGNSFQDYVGVITEPATTVVGGGAGGTNSHYFNVARTDQLRVAHYTGMLNLYYDFNNRSRFTPYVGGGVGLAIHTMTRRHRESAASCTYSTNSVSGAYVDAAGAPVCASAGVAPGPVEPTPSANEALVTAASSSSGAATGYGLAGNAIVGGAYDLGEGWKLDLNYRYTWMSGDVQLTTTAFNGRNTVHLGDVTEHALRAGVRMDIN